MSTVAISSDGSHAVLRVNSRTFGDFECLIDLEDAERVNQLTWSVRVSKGLTYFVTRIRNEGNSSHLVRLNRFIMRATDKTLMVDHVNPAALLDNRKTNLRFCTHQENNRNRRCNRKPSTSQFKGVSWDKRLSSWRSYITVDNKYKHLGCYETEEEAARSYDVAAQDFFGEFARINLPLVVVA